MNVTWTQDLTGDMLHLTCYVGVQLLRNPMIMCDNSINIVGHAEACLGWVECMCGPGIDESEGIRVGWTQLLPPLLLLLLSHLSHISQTLLLAPDRALPIQKSR